jgi:hypothetical protein
LTGELESAAVEVDNMPPAITIQNAAFDRVKGLMSCADLFDMSRLDVKDREKYGPGTDYAAAARARHHGRKRKRP